MVMVVVSGWRLTARETASKLVACSFSHFTLAAPAACHLAGVGAGDASVMCCRVRAWILPCLSDVHMASLMWRDSSTAAGVTAHPNCTRLALHPGPVCSRDPAGGLGKTRLFHMPSALGLGSPVRPCEVYCVPCSAA